MAEAKRKTEKKSAKNKKAESEKWEIQKQELLHGLMQPIEQAKNKGSKLDVDEINDYFQDCDLSLEGIEHVYSYPEDSNIEVQHHQEEEPSEDLETGGKGNAILDLGLDLDDDLDVEDENEEKVEGEEINLNPVDLPEDVDTEDPVRIYLKKIGTVSLLTTEEEMELMRRKQAGDEKVKKKLIKTNLRLVVSVAKCHTDHGISFPNLIQEGNFELIKGVEKLNPEKGFRLSTYATRWTRQSMARTLTDQAKTIRMPVHMVETINKMSKMQHKLTLKLGYEPNVAGLAKALDMTEEKVMEIIQIAHEPASLETPIGEEDDSNLGDFVAGNSVLTPEDSVELVILREHIEALFGDLKERGRQVIMLRLSLEDSHPKTLEGTGREFKVTRERIRQVETKAPRKLRSPVRSKRIRDFL